MKPIELPTLREEHKHSACYFGEHPGWIIAYTRTRDSDCLQESNFAVLLALLGGEGETVEISRSSHWACGWVEYLTIDPADVERIKIATEAHARLADYPILDEDDFSDREQASADETWKNCYNPAERIEYIRKYRNQFDFQSLGDALDCVRGKYFAGHASELIN